VTTQRAVKGMTIPHLYVTPPPFTESADADPAATRVSDIADRPKRLYYLSSPLGHKLRPLETQYKASGRSRGSEPRPHEGLRTPFLGRRRPVLQYETRLGKAQNLDNVFCSVLEASCNPHGVAELGPIGVISRSIRKNGDTDVPVLARTSRLLRATRDSA
jgi:hypothetical protein